MWLSHIRIERWRTARGRLSCIRTKRLNVTAQAANEVTMLGHSEREAHMCALAGRLEFAVQKSRKRFTLIRVPPMLRCRCAKTASLSTRPRDLWRFGNCTATDRPAIALGFFRKGQFVVGETTPWLYVKSPCANQASCTVTNSRIVSTSPTGNSPVVCQTEADKLGDDVDVETFLTLARPDCGADRHRALRIEDADAAGEGSCGCRDRQRSGPQVSTVNSSV